MVENILKKESNVAVGLKKKNEISMNFSCSLHFLSNASETEKAILYPE